MSPRLLDVAVSSVRQPTREFHSQHYLRHTQRRQEHLASLALPLEGKSVLEVGAGVGDHTSFFIDRSCTVTVTEARRRNVRALRRRYPKLDVRQLDLDRPRPDFDVTAEVTYCYGTLYHLSRPAEALVFLAERTAEMILVETCVIIGDEDELILQNEPRLRPSQSVHGLGCRPTRRWVWNRLAALFEHVYATTTQPWDIEFPLDWSAPRPDGCLTRAVFVASRSPIDGATLISSPPDRQVRH